MPTIYAIPNGRTVMDATIWSGNSVATSITNTDNATIGFTPDLVWIKNRSNNVYWNVWYDTVRGVGNQLSSNQTDAELANASNVAGKVSAFNSNGFSLASGSSSIISVNGSGSNYVAWQWQAGANTTVTNTTGTITANVSANTTAGFSIVTYAGSNASATVGHGLGKTPTFIIYKSRTSSSWNWLVNIGAITGTQGDYIYLNGTQGVLNSGNVLNANSSVFSLLTSPENNGSGQNYVAYCWAPITGFSAFGKYTGNGNADGPFVYTGFRPKCIFIKNIGNASDWTIWDTTRNPYNLLNLELNPNNSSNEYVANTADFLSNGFKMRSTYGNTNGNGYTYVYAAFAENPFAYANAR